jgi:hypothetical protein
MGHKKEGEIRFYTSAQKDETHSGFDLGLPLFLFTTLPYQGERPLASGMGRKATLPMQCRILGKGKGVKGLSQSR